MSAKREELHYGLRSGVEIKTGPGALYLVSGFPLKTVSLHLSWKAMLDRLAAARGMAFRDIAADLPPEDHRKAKRFLDDLVRKGYLFVGGLDPASVLPSVTVIIPVRNRPREIAACLESLERVLYPHDKLDIVVVDDASTDETPSVVGRFPVRLVALEKHRQASSCRNIGAAAAKGEILAFLDSDCMADPLWLKELVPAFEHPDVSVVGGLVDTAMGTKGLDRYEQVRSSLKVASWFKRSSSTESFFYVPSCNLLVRRETFSRLGGFREDLLVGEDVDLCWRAEDAGHLVDYRPQGRVFHKHRNSMKGFCSRRFEYGTSEPLLQRLHRTRTKRLVLLPSSSVFWALLLLAVAGESVILFGLPWLWALADGTVKFAGIRTQRLPVGFASVLRAVLRNYWAFFYHCCAFASRYYILGAVLLLPFFPTLSWALAFAHIVAGTTEFFVKRPALNLPEFLVYFSAEQIAYQTGVWWSCFRQRCFSPVNPNLVLRLPK